MRRGAEYPCFFLWLSSLVRKVAITRGVAPNRGRFGAFLVCEVSMMTEKDSGTSVSVSSESERKKEFIDSTRFILFARVCDIFSRGGEGGVFVEAVHALGSRPLKFFLASGDLKDHAVLKQTFCQARLWMDEHYPGWTEAPCPDKIFLPGDIVIVDRNSQSPGL